MTYTGTKSFMRVGEHVIPDRDNLYTFTARFGTAPETEAALNAGTLLHAPPACTTKTGAAADQKRWHLRFGHASAASMSHLKYLVTGLDVVLLT